MKPLHKVSLALFACLFMIAGVAVATNLKPVPNVLGANSLAAPQILSTDPQIANCNLSSTGVVVTESTLTTLASTAEYPCVNLRGAIEATSSTGLIAVQRNGLYRVDFNANCTGATTVTGRLTAQYSVDGGSNYTQITGADARNLFLTGALQQNMGGSGYVTIASTPTLLASDQVVIALRGSTSDASDMTCANGGGLRVERVDTPQPVTYP